MRATRLRHVVNALGRFPFDARTHFVGLLTLIAYCAHQAVLFQSDFVAWDWRVISAFALLLIGIRVAARIDDLLSHALRRLCALGVITCSRDEFERLNRTLALRRRKWAPVWGLTIGLAIGLAFAAGWDWNLIDNPWRLALLAVEAPIFYVAGYYIGWMVVQGGLARVLRTLGISYSVQPGHPDGAAGLRPLGDFFFRQAMLAGLPAAYVAFWLALLPYILVHPDFVTYSYPPSMVVFGKPILLELILLPIFLFIAAAAFVWPMWAFHRVMVSQKRVLVPQADEIARRISGIQAELRRSTNSAPVKELKDRLAVDLKRFEELEGLPTWPVRKQIGRWFALQNLTLVVFPIISLLAGGTSRVLEALKEFFAR